MPILKSVNKLDVKYGFPEYLEYKDDEWNGHIKGVAIASSNEDGTELENYLSSSIKEDKNTLLEEILYNKDIQLVSRFEPQLDKHTGIIKRKKVFYLPYIVPDHSIWKPSINFMHISEEEAMEVTVELLFSIDGFNRYATVSFDTRNNTIFGYISNLFKLYTKVDNYEKLGVKQTRDGYDFDFYDAVGNKAVMQFCFPEDLRAALISFRIISFREIDE